LRMCGSAAASRRARWSCDAGRRSVSGRAG